MILAQSAVGKKSSPKQVALWATAPMRREPGIVAVPAGVSGGAAVEGNRRDRQRGAQAAAAGLAGQGVYRGSAHALKHRGKQLEDTPIKERRLPGGYVRPAQSKGEMKRERSAWKAKHKLGDVQGQELREAIQRNPAAMRDYYRSAARPYKRAAAQIATGRRGLVVSGVATALPAAAVLRRDQVGKAVYGVQERYTSRRRQAEFLAGGALAAYGLSRHKMLGPLTAYGVRIAERQGAKPDQVERVLSAARAVGRGVRETTGRGEAQLRRVSALDHAIEAIPMGLRPAVATTAGVMLVNHARPVTRDRFVPHGRY